MEIWKDIIGYEGQYQISSHGRVKSLARDVSFGKSIRHIPEQIKNQQIDKYGYPYLMLSIKGKKTKFMVHQLVAKHFIPNPENKPQVNHISRIKTDNSVDNLEWMTNKENMRHSYEDIYPKASRNARKVCSKPVAQFDGDWNFIAQYPSLTEAGKVVGADKNNISQAIKRGGKCAKFNWKWGIHR